MIASEIGLEPDAFEAALTTVDVNEHISNTRRFMAQIGAGGFPAFVLQIGAQWYGVPHQQFAANAAGFADWLAQMLEQQPTSNSA